MAASTGDFFKDMQQRQTEAMEAFQSAVSDSMKAWQDALSTATAPPSGDGGTSTPFGQMPSPTQIADAYFSFAEQMLARQHEFAIKLIDVATPKSPS